MENAAELFVPLSFFFFLAVIIIGPSYLKSRDRLRMHETLRTAYEKGQPVPPEMIAALQSDRAKPAPERDLRRGIVLVAIAAAMIVLGLTINQIHETDGHALWPILGASAFPGFVGIGYIAFWFASRRKAA